MGLVKKYQKVEASNELKLKKKSQGHEKWLLLFSDFYQKEGRACTALNCFQLSVK